MWNDLWVVPITEVLGLVLADIADILPMPLCSVLKQVLHPCQLLLIIINITLWEIVVLPLSIIKQHLLVHSPRGKNGAVCRPGDHQRCVPMPAKAAVHLTCGRVVDDD